MDVLRGDWARRPECSMVVKMSLLTLRGGLRGDGVCCAVEKTLLFQKL